MLGACCDRSSRLIKAPPEDDGLCSNYRKQRRTSHCCEFFRNDSYSIDQSDRPSPCHGRLSSPGGFFRGIEAASQPLYTSQPLYRRVLAGSTYFAQVPKAEGRKKENQSHV